MRRLSTAGLLFSLSLPTSEVALAGARSEPGDSRAGVPPVSAPVDPAAEAALSIIADNVRALIDTGSLNGAALEVERLLLRAPETLRFRLLAIEVYYRLGRDEEVGRQAAAALAIEPRALEPHRWLARLARWRGELPAARAHLQNALRVQPGSASLLSDLGALYAAGGEWRRAHRFFRKAVLAPADDPVRWLDAALSLSDAEERDSALRRLEEAFPQYAPGRAWAALCRSIPGQRLWDAAPWSSPVELPLTYEQRYFPIVEARVGADLPIRLLIDTGSPGLKLSRQVADRLGLRSFGTLQVGGLGSGPVAKSDLVLLDSLRLGNLLVRHVPAGVLDSLPMADGLLNPMALQVQTARLEVSRRRLVLGDNDRLMPRGSSRLPFLNLDQHPIVRMILNGSPRLAMIDSGSGATVLDETTVRQIPERRPMLLEGIEFGLSGVLGQVADAKPVHIERLRLGGFEIENPLLFEADLSRLGKHLGTQVQLLFGADFLSRFDVTFDYRRLEMAIEPPAPRRKRALRSDS